MVSIAYEPAAHLPPLSWCARVRAGEPVRVRHGPGVDAREQGWVEGAWDGDFDAFDFDAAEVLCGSGGRVRGGALVFATPFHPLERLFALRAGGTLLVSNSLVFALVEAGDRLDHSYPHYFFDLVQQVRAGLAAKPTRLKTAAGRSVEMFRCCNVNVCDGHTQGTQPKTLSAAPANYADYFDMLLSATRRLAANAAADGRRRAYRLVAACSRGYDSTASTAVAARAGCREGVTFAASTARSGHPLLKLKESRADDSGADSLRALGLSVAEFERSKVREIAGCPEAEFFFNCASAPTDLATRVMEPVVKGSVLVSGRHGERYWGPTIRSRRRNFAEIDDCNLSGNGLTEFRLRADLLHLPLPYIGALHGPAIYAITQSREMDPWRLGKGYYDRPIARRMAEEAGIPRANFGHAKLGTTPDSRGLSAESNADFQAFLKSDVPEAVRERLDPRSIDQRLAAHRRLAYLRTHWAHLPGVDRLLHAIGVERMNRLANSINLYQFHWGAAKLRERYR